MKRQVNYAYSIITAIVTVVAFMEILTSESLKTWTKIHSESIFYGLIFLFMIMGSLLTYSTEQKRKYRELRAATTHVESSEHDRNLFQGLMKELPPTGSVIEWLKENFMANLFLKEDYKVIQAVLRDLKLQAVGFDNEKVGASYIRLHMAMQVFEDKTAKYMWYAPDGEHLHVPPEWDDDRFEKATDEIDAARISLVEEYDNFLKIAHEGKIDQQGAVSIEGRANSDATSQ